MDLEKRKITKEEGLKAQKALEALEIKPSSDVKSEDVDFIVSLHCVRPPALSRAGDLSLVCIEKNDLLIQLRLLRWDVRRMLPRMLCGRTRGIS